MSVRGMQVGSAAMAAAALLAACSGDGGGQPQTAAPASTSPSTPALTAPSPSQSPSTAAAVPQDDPAQVARQYYEAVERAYNTLDSSQLEELSAPDCAPCADQLEFVRELKRDGQRISGADFKVTRGFQTALQGGRASARIVVTFSGMKLIDARGQVVRTVPGRSREQQLDLERISRGWVVREISGLEG